MTDLITISRKDEQVTNRWSGGSTTQLAIYPDDADYNQRNFTWRLSSALVEVEESAFTPLPGFWRLLMILEGELFIEHEGHHSASLQPFEQDAFSGGWTTRSKGKVRDFNLMVAKGCSGRLKAIHAQPGIQHERVGEREQPHPHVDEAFYCIDGSIAISIDDKQAIALSAGDVLLMSKISAAKTIAISNQSDEAATIIRASLFY
ncbi:HutD/Ves family protein [Brevibacillus sp. NRS-1366]|uniref:HutD/Ves family protein n=1 Tax=Brevibacillus sp. NRS-1366 TaxID=3233899 RepID=UPI003D21D1E5